MNISGQRSIGGLMPELKANSTTQAISTAERLLYDLGWASLLIVTGVFWLIPDARMPGGSWLIAVGVIILLFTLARLIYRYSISVFAFSAGMIALIAGISSVLGLGLPLFPIALIVIGCSIILVRQLEHGSDSPAEENPLCRR